MACWDSLPLAIFALVVAYLAYVFVIRYWNYFSDRNIAFERGVPFLGSQYKTFLGQESFVGTVTQVYNKYAEKHRIIGMYELGGRPSHMVLDPKLVQAVTIKDFDYFVNHYFQLDSNSDPLMSRVLFSMTNENWRNMRSTLSPLFTGSKMRHMLALMNDTTAEFISHVQNEIMAKSPKAGIEYNLDELLTCLTNDMIGSTAFGLKMNTVLDRENEFYKAGTRLAYALMSLKTFFVLSMPKLCRLLGVSILNAKDSQFFRDIIHETVDARKKSKIVRNDMLQLLLMAQDGKLEIEKENDAQQDTGFATITEMLAVKTSEKLKNWTDDDLVAQCIVFFLAGFTGISTTLSFIMYELSMNQDIQERLYQEIKETNDRLDGKPLSFEVLQKMTYLDMVVSEVLRLWPIGAMMDRKVSKQYMIEDYNGQRVLLQPNDVLWIPVFGIHRDAKYHPNPDKFDPERFSEANKRNIDMNTYLPFGSGPRACIASRFALLQLKAITYSLLLAFKVDRSAKTAAVMTLKKGAAQVTSADGFFNQLKLRNPK